MKRSERRKFVNEMMTHLQWLKTKENADRMEDKGMLKTGIVHDGLMMLFDFAEKEGLSLIEILDWLVIGIANQRGGSIDDPIRTEFTEIWKVTQKFARKDFLRRKGVSL